MKKIIIYTIAVILIFLLSIYIGLKLTSSNEEKEEIGTSQEEEQSQIQINEIEPAISEEKANKEHYVLKEVNKYVKVYSVDDNEKQELYLSTDIATEYLPEADKISLKKGIHVYSKKELNEILQDFE